MSFQDKTIYSIEYSNDGMHYAVGLADCSIRIFDGVTRKEEIVLGGKDNLKVVGHMNKIYSLRYHKDNPKILISGGWDDNVLFWDLTSGTPIKVIVGPHIFGEGLDINCFGEVLTASWRKDDPLEIWDYESGNRKMSVDWNFKEREDSTKTSTQLYCCKYSKDFGKLIYAGGSQINSVKIFDWSGAGVATIDKFSHACLALDSSNDFSNNEQLFACGGGEGIVRMFKVKYGPNFK
jgi:COMPASS component SWD3